MRLGVLFLIMIAKMSIFDAMDLKIQNAMNRVCFLLLLCCLSSCKMNKTERMEMSEDSIDTVGLDRGVGKKTVSDSLKIGIVDDGDCLQRQLLAIHEELRKDWKTQPTHSEECDRIWGGVALHRYRFDGEYSRAAERVPGEDNGLPRFLFSWCRSPRHQRESKQESYSWHPYPSRISGLFNESSPCDIHPQQSQRRRFDLRRALLPDVRRRKRYLAELPINAAFWDIAYVLRDGEERVMKASLYPDVHPNKPGRYRYFYEITIRRKPVLMMAEFRLTDNEEEWRTAEKTSLSPYISDAGKGGSPQLITEEPMEEPVYKVVEVMPEFPGGMKALMDFIQKRISVIRKKPVRMAFREELLSAW